MASAPENKGTSDVEQEEINALREHFKDKIRILSSIGQFSYILKIRADQYDVSLTLQLDQSYPAKAPEIIITAPRLTPDQILLVQRLLQSYTETLLNQPMVLLIYARLLQWLDENNIQTLNVSTSSTTAATTTMTTTNASIPSAPRSPTNSKTVASSIAAAPTNPPPRTDESEQEQSKKSSMKTAEDVISRIEWDTRLDSRCFRVGYDDRFLGLQEKPFSDFDFKVDLSTVSDRHSVILAIPKHRIRYFKYNNEIVWDKETRTDLMFGSTGNQETINDVLQRHEQLMDSNHSSSIPHDDISLSHDAENEQEDKESNPMSTPRYLTLTDGAYKPNYFLSIPITDPSFLTNYNTYREHLLSSYPLLFSSRPNALDSGQLHLTLLTIRLETSVELEQCLLLLKRFQEEIRYHCSYPERICLEFKGIDTFYDRTLFVKCQQNRRLENLRTLIVERFCEQQQKQSRPHGIFLAGNYAEFIPHVTLLKSKRKFSSVCQNETKKELDFGRQTIDCLQLSSIGKTETGSTQDPYTFKLDLS